MSEDMQPKSPLGGGSSRADCYAHLVALSGGKDSTALALRLQEVEPRDYIYFCTPTGEELPEMELHWQNLERLLGRPIIRVTNKEPGFGALEEAIFTMQALPNWRMRWCTRILKIEAAQDFYLRHMPCVVYVGLRADEESRKGGLFGEGVIQRYPLRGWGWGVNDVWNYLNRRGVRIPRRTDCGCCFYQRIGEWWNLWKYHPELWAKYERLEAGIGKTFLSPGKFKNWPSPLKDLRGEFEKGRVPRGANTEGPDPFADFETSGVCRACSL